MSGLENYSASEAWRSHLKKLLLMERKPTQLNPQPFVPVKDSQRFSLDLVEDLKIILEEKRIPNNRAVTAQIVAESKEMYKSDKMLYQEDEEDKENRMGRKNKEWVDDTLLEERDMSQWQRTSDESFEAIEKMCNKTASDPDSTLFQYLHSENQEHVLASAKKRSFEGSSQNSEEGYDAETMALQRLLDDLRVEDQQQLDNESPLKGVDDTQLEDIEAPSRLWENTITGDTILQTSPVKMVGLLRPSTILEENAEESTSCCSNSSSHASFESALRSDEGANFIPGEPSSSCYETANDSIATSCATNTTDDVFGAIAAFVHRSSSDENAQEQEVPHDLIELDESTDLIDLEKTFSPLVNSPDSSDFEESVIEISDGENSPEKETEPETPGSINVKIEQNSLFKANSSETNYPADANNCSGISLRTFEADTNCSYEANDSGAERSMKFDNTMEEVDYMLQKGLEYMAAAKIAKKPTETVAKSPASQQKLQLPTFQDTFLPSPKAKQQWDSPKSATQKQKLLEDNLTNKGVTYSSPRGKPLNRFALDIKPMPKLDVFKKPSGIPTCNKNRHKDQFSHVVSPIGAYMKKTGTTPLLATLKPRTRKADVHNSSALRALEYESRLYKPEFHTNADAAVANSPCKLSGVPTPTRTLPKKAYISSEYKHIVDERTPITIPGGKKIQKYLESAMLPAVVRHEGKLKMPEGTGGTLKLSAKEQQQNTAGSRRTDLGDLSVMSGDVSVYTIMDAHKF